MVGVLGVIFGLLLVFGMMYLYEKVYFILLLILMLVWLFVIFYGGLELFLGVFGWMLGVVYFVYLGGMFGGWLLI